MNTGLRVLVTGAGGQLGRELVACAPAWPLTLLPTTRQELDITVPQAIESTFNRLAPDLVINAAGFTQVDPAEQEPELALRCNRDAVGELAQACARRGIPLFHLSTDYVFDGKLGRPYRETDTPAPLGVYGLSKQQGEERLRAALAEHLCLRVSWVFGRYAQNFVSTVLRLAREQERLRIVADQWSAPTPATALAHTLLHLAQRYREQGRLPWGLYHYCGTPHASRFELASTVLERALALGLLARRPELEPVASAAFPTPAARPLDSRLDGSHFVETFGLPLPDWRAALDETLLAWKEGGA